MRARHAAPERRAAVPVPRARTFFSETRPGGGGGLAPPLGTAAPGGDGGRAREGTGDWGGGVAAGPRSPRPAPARPPNFEPPSAPLRSESSAVG